MKALVDRLTTGDLERPDPIASVRCSDQDLIVTRTDGRTITVPLWGGPRLPRATPAQRENWEILPFGDALHWPDTDEDLEVRGFLVGGKGPRRAATSVGMEGRHRDSSWIHREASQ